jgi:predicted Zn-dependent protease
MVWIAASLVVLAFPAMALAHGDLHDQIAAATHRIEQQPGSAALYLGRARLYRVHREWAEALADLDRAVRLEPGLEGIDLARGITLLDAGRPSEASAVLDRVLASRPDQADAWLARARALVALGDPGAAATDYSRALARLRRVTPEHYVERMRALMAAGDLEEALRGLDEGIARLGPVVSLELAAIDLELRQGRPDRALRRLDAAASRSPRQETWLARRGEILEAAGREAEARDAYAACLAALETLPAGRRQTRTLEDLRAKVRAALARLEARR